MLGCHVREGPSERLGAGAGVLGDRRRDPEIDDACPAIAVHEHVLGLEIAVDDARAVRRSESVAGTPEHRQHLSPRPRPLGEPATQGGTGDVIHDQKRGAIGERDLVDCDDVRVRQASHGLRLCHELRATPRDRAEHPIAAQQLDRDLALQHRVVGGEHHAHAANPQRVEHQEAADRARGHDGLVSLRRRQHARPTLVRHVCLRTRDYTGGTRIRTVSMVRAAGKAWLGAALAPAMSSRSSDAEL